MSKEDIFPKKWDKALPPGFKEESEAFSEDQLKASIVKSNKAISIAEKDMDEDEELAASKDELKRLAEPFKEAIKEAHAQARYCVFLLNQRGNV